MPDFGGIGTNCFGASDFSIGTAIGIGPTFAGVGKFVIPRSCAFVFPCVRGFGPAVVIGLGAAAGAGVGAAGAGFAATDFFAAAGALAGVAGAGFGAATDFLAAALVATGAGFLEAVAFLETEAAPAAFFTTGAAVFTVPEDFLGDFLIVTFLLDADFDLAGLLFAVRFWDAVEVAFEAFAGLAEVWLGLTWLLFFLQRPSWPAS